METVLKILLANFFKFLSKLSPSVTAEIAWSFFCKPRIRKKPLSTLESELLQQANQYSIDSGEYKISVYQWGSANNSNTKTVLLTHGWGGHALNFAHIIDKLLVSNFNVVAYDSPAHGESSGGKTHLFHNTQALLAVSKSLVSEFKNVHALIGHSFGTLANSYALALCKENAFADHACLSQVEKLILIAGPNKVTDIFAAFTQAMHLPDSVLNIFHQKVEVIAKRKIESLSVTELLNTFRGQSLVIHDQNDRIVPFSEAESVAEDSGASLFATSGYGHFRILKTKTVIEKIVDFLEPE